MPDLYCSCASSAMLDKSRSLSLRRYFKVSSAGETAEKQTRQSMIRVVFITPLLSPPFILSRWKGTYRFETKKLSKMKNSAARTNIATSGKNPQPGILSFYPAFLLLPGPLIRRRPSGPGRTIPCRLHPSALRKADLPEPQKARRGVLRRPWPPAERPARRRPA